MNYIYDVLLNFNKEYFDFYEWNEDDDINQIRKIPIIKVSKKQLSEIKNNEVKFKEETLKYICNKTEKFKQNSIVKIKYALIITDGDDALALKLNKDGINSYKSSMLLEESEDVLDIIKFTKEIKLEYDIIKKNKIKPFKTRFEIENEALIENELNKIYNEKDISKLNFLCLECLGKSESNIDKAYIKLKKELTCNKSFHKMYDIFKITKK